VMIRRGPWKFIHSPVDPDQLYHLAADPDELVNCAADAAYAEQVEAFRQEIAAGWDLAVIERDVLASQRRRHLIGAANAAGTHHSWDWQPVRDASREYIRNHMDLELLEASARFPRVRPV